MCKSESQGESTHGCVGEFPTAEPSCPLSCRAKTRRFVMNGGSVHPCPSPWSLSGGAYDHNAFDFLPIEDK